MAKNSKTESSNGVQPANGAAPSVEETPAPKKRAPAAAKKTAAKKSSAKVAVKKTATRSAARKKKAYEPTDNEIRIRAYFIAERRAQMELGGDQSADWLEARQQLLEESKAAAK